MRDNIKTAWNTAIKRAGLQNMNLTPYCLRRTRLSIWDQIDSDCSRYCGGHVPSDVHSLHYVKYTNSRIFKLVNIEIKQPLKLLQAFG
jgi:integrase